MATGIEVHYLRADARYEKARGELGNKVVSVPSAEQAHSLSRSRLFIPNAPVTVWHLTDLLDRSVTPVPQESVTTSKRIVICEAHQIVPLLPEGGEQEKALLSFRLSGSSLPPKHEPETQQEGAHNETMRLWFNLGMAEAFVMFGITGLILLAANFQSP